MSLERLSLRADLALTLLNVTPHVLNYFLARSRPPWRGIRNSARSHSVRHTESHWTRGLPTG
jgi:hypothetical protein